MYHKIVPHSRFKNRQQINVLLELFIPTTNLSLFNQINVIYTIFNTAKNRDFPVNCSCRAAWIGKVGSHFGEENQVIFLLIRCSRKRVGRSVFLCLKKVAKKWRYQ